MFSHIKEWDLKKDQVPWIVYRLEKYNYSLEMKTFSKLGTLYANFTDLETIFK